MTSSIALKLLAMSALFVFSSGAAFTEFGRQHRLLVVLASVVALAGTFYLAQEVYKDIIKQVKDDLVSAGEMKTKNGEAPPASKKLKDTVAKTEKTTKKHGVITQATKKPGLKTVTLPAQKPTRFTHGYKFDDCNGADWCPKMIVVRSGFFTMGSESHEIGRSANEGPRHNVSIKRFSVGQAEVTRNQYLQFTRETEYVYSDECWTNENFKWKLRSNRHFLSPGFSQTGDHPVVCVSWDDAQAYLNWLGKKTKQRYRFLTEAEWEYVASAQASTLFWWGDTISINQANYNGADFNKKFDGINRMKTVPIFSFRPNPFGLFNVHGNVAEWVMDCQHDSYANAPTDGSAWLNNDDGDCTMRLGRGGAWNDFPSGLRTRQRLSFRQGDKINSLGFRVARDL